MNKIKNIFEYIEKYIVLIAWSYFLDAIWIMHLPLSFENKCLSITYDSIGLLFCLIIFLDKRKK